MSLTKLLIDESQMAKVAHEFGVRNVQVDGVDKNGNIKVQVTDEQCDFLGVPSATDYELDEMLATLKARIEVNINLGSDVEDSVTGFAGVVTAVTQYLAEDEPMLCVENDKSERWFSHSRLEKLED